MRNCLFLISLALSSAACSSGEEEPATAMARNAATASATTSAVAAPAATDKTAGSAAAFDFEDNAQKDGGNRAFAYRWPAAVSEIPALVARFTADRDEQLASQKAEWSKSFDDAPDGCIACISRGYEKEWKVVADLPQYLSLSADLYVYTGGAHGNSDKQSLVFSRQAGRAVAGVEMFKSPVALETALGAALCDRLDDARARKRGAPVERSAQWSTDCPGIDEATVLIGSSSGETFDRIGVYFGPYVAGAYAEGAYELDFPVTASVLDAVKPEFASAFSVRR